MVVCELCGDTKCKNCSCGHKHKEVKVRFCPECKATDVKFVFQLKNLFGLVPRMTCMQCGNHSPDFPILVVPAKKKTTKKTAKSAKSRTLKGAKR